MFGEACGELNLRCALRKNSVSIPLASQGAIFLFLGCMVACAGCGYRIRSSVGDLPAGIQSLGVPTFKNSSPQFKLEQRITGAVLKELAVRTRVAVNSSAAGVEAVLIGEIGSISASPVTFGTNSFASAFLVTVQIRAKLVRAKDSAVLWEDDSFLFRERYVLNTKLADFFSEENPALDRLAHDFAASLVSTILNR